MIWWLKQPDKHKLAGDDIASSFARWPVGSVPLAASDTLYYSLLFQPVLEVSEK